MEPTEQEFNPYKNDKVIAIIQNEDGNWTGYMQKHGKVVDARQSDPQIVLQMLLTHP